MCFSAAASFTAAGVTSAAGIVSLARVQARWQAPLAAVPLVFAAQQALEGAVWLTLPSRRADAFALAFVVVAEVVWPAVAPLVAVLHEKSPVRRRIIWTLWAVGLAVAAYLASAVVARPPAPAIVGHHIAYVGQDAQPWPVVAGYVAATAGAMLVSSRRVVAALGAVVAAGYVASSWFAAQAFLSVWCFFAAIGSLTILVYFLARPRSSPSPA